MKSLTSRIHSTQATLALAVVAVLAVISGCGKEESPSNAAMMQDNMQSSETPDGMMKDGMMKDGMMKNGMMKDGMMKDGMMKDGAAPAGAEMQSEKKM